MFQTSIEEQQAGHVIGSYTPRAVEYLPYNSESPRVADWMARIITASASDLYVEHIGSTAVPGCWGKGIIDLLVLHRPGEAASAGVVLDRIGFQGPQRLDIMPEPPPLRVGSVEYIGRIYRVHIYGAAARSDDAAELLKFRDLLRGNTGLRRVYEAEKRALFARGAAGGAEYSKAKGYFIEALLAAAEL